MSPMMKLLLRAGLVIWQVSRLEGGVWGRVLSDEENLQPVGADGQCDPLCSQRAGEDLRGHGPGYGPPSSPKCEHVEQ